MIPTVNRVPQMPNVMSSLRFRQRLNLIRANPVIVVDTVDTRLDLARAVGATHTVNPTSQDLGAEIARICRRAPKGALDAVGAPRTRVQAVDIVGTGETVVVLGLGKVGATFDVPISPLVQQEKRIIGTCTVVEHARGDSEILQLLSGEPKKQAQPRRSLARDRAP
jgi:Zn-dependent alcohol dehydrogenase